MATTTSIPPLKLRVKSGVHYSTEEIDEMKQTIVTLVKYGKSISEIVRNRYVPCSEVTIYKWLEKDDHFNERVERSREIGKWIKVRESCEEHLEAEIIAAVNYRLAAYLLQKQLIKVRVGDVMVSEGKDTKYRVNEVIKAALNIPTPTITAKMTMYYHEHIEPEHRRRAEEEAPTVNPEEVERARVLLQGI